MIKIKKILFPTDFSECSLHALDYVREFAKLHGSEVLVLHVAELTGSNTYVYAPLYPEINNDILHNARVRMNELENTLSDEPFAVKTSIVHNKPFVGIVEVAQKEAADLIIMATHGYGPVKHMLLGSTAERVVQKAPCPVLTVRHPEHEFVHPCTAEA